MIALATDSTCDLPVEIVKARQIQVGCQIVKQIRRALGMSQVEFAAHFGFSVRTLQEWEQGRSAPRGVARNFLILLQREPDLVRQVLLGAVPTEDPSRS